MKTYAGITLGILLAMVVSVTRAAPVYTWVDNEGVTHFSEAPPADPATDAQQLNVQPASGAAPENGFDEDFYSIINQARRMESHRLEREKLTADKELAKAEASKARAAARATNYIADNSPDNTPVYLAYPRYAHRPRPGHHKHHAHPDHSSRPRHSRRPPSPRTSLGKTRGMRW